MSAVPGSAATLLHGRYRLDRPLGHGASGAVWAAFDVRERQRVAIKHLTRLDALSLYRFKQEFRSLASARHPNLVTLHELFAVDEDWYLAMELIDGVDFFGHVRGTASLIGTALPTGDPRSAATVAPRDGAHFDPRRDEPRLRSALAQLVSGVSALHETGRLHRDLKPPNVLVERAGRVVILDFGLAAPARGVSEVPALGEGLVGTPLYMAPEQVSGEPLGPAADWYAVGVMLYECLTGAVPFGGDVDAILESKLTRDGLDPRAVDPRVPDALGELCARLLRRDPAARPSGAELCAALALEVGAGPQPAGHFVGRGDELGQLRAAWRRARAGTRTNVHVLGPSGIGKTALLERFVTEIEAQEDGRAVALRGIAYEHESVPYKAIDALIDALATYLRSLPGDEVAELLPPDIGVLARVFPVLAWHEAIGAEGDASAMPPSEQRRRAFAALRELLARLAARRPTVIWIDDAQWGDVDSTLLLRELLAEPAPPPLLFLLSYRSEARGDALIEAMRRSASVDATIELGPLSERDALALAHSVAGGRLDDACSALARQAEGSPFVVCELVRELVEQGGHGEVEIAGLLGRRLANLAAGPRRLLQVVAVAGRPVDRGLAAVVAALDRPIEGVLRELRGARLLRTVSLADEALKLHHDRVREAIVAGIPAEARREIDLAIADELERRGGDPEAIAAHLISAGAVERARAHVLPAAERAVEKLAFDRAAELYRIAIALSAVAPSALQRALADTLASAGRGKEAADAYLAAIPGATAAEAHDLRRLASEQLLRSGHHDDGIALLSDFLGPVGLGVPRSRGAAIATLIARRLQLRVRGIGFVERAEQALPAERLRRIDACWSAGIGLTGAEPLRGWVFLTRHLLMALSAGEPRRIARGLAIEGYFGSSAGGTDLDQGLRFAARAEEIGRRLEDPYTLVLVGLCRGAIACFRYDWPAAIAELRAVDQLSRERGVGIGWEMSGVHTLLAQALYLSGDLNGARAHVASFVRDAQARDDRYRETLLRGFVMSLLRLADDRPDLAREDLVSVVRWWSRSGFHLMHLNRALVEPLIAIYEGRDGLALIEAHGQGMRRSGMLRQVTIAIGYHEVCARTLLACYTPQRARELGPRLAREIAWLRRLPEAWPQGLAAFLEAGHARARGDDDAALTGIRTAEQLLERAGLRTYVAIARRNRGSLLGGDAGRDLILEADAHLRAQAVVDPERYAACHLPGWQRR